MSTTLPDSPAGPRMGLRALAQVLDWLLPSPCLACDASVGEVTPILGLCPKCRATWPSRSTGRCQFCGRALGASVGPSFSCAACNRQRSVPYRRLVVGWSYRSPVTECIRGLKFLRQERLAVHLVDRLLDELSTTEVELLDRCDRVTPVPLWWRRKLTRGYNQARLLANRLALRLELPCDRILVRRRGARRQSELPRAARRSNVCGSFSVNRRSAALGSVLLVDDVVTTGATLRECASTLLQAGAREVTVLAIARTPEAEDAVLLQPARSLRGDFRG